MGEKEGCRMRQYFEPTDSNTNLFRAPFYKEAFIKAEQEGNDLILFITASTENIDQQNEKMAVQAVKEAAPEFLKSGVISYDHLHVIEKSPEYIVGEPLDVKFSKDNETLVKARLYSENPIAVSLYNNIKSRSSRFGASLGGYTLKKAKDDSGVSNITKIAWTDLAVTYKPVVAETQGRISLKPFSEFAEFAKALQAGTGVDAAAYAGGRALVTESMQGSTVNVLPQMGIGEMEANQIVKDLMEEIKEGKIATRFDLFHFAIAHSIPFSCIEQAVDYFATKLIKINAQLIKEVEHA